MQHGGPEQRVEIGDVFADEVVLLGGRVGNEVAVAARFSAGSQGAALVEVVLQRGQIANGRVQPNVEVFARCVGNFDAEVGRVTGNVPIAQAAVAFCVLGEPLLDFVQHLGLQVTIGMRPCLQELGATRVAQGKKVMFRLLHHRRCAGQGRIRVFQFGGGVHRATHLAAVAVLVFRVALGAGALDESVGQEHGLFGVIKLLNGFGRDQAVGFERTVDVLRQLVILGAIRAVPVVESDVEPVQVGLAARRDVGHELLGRDTRFFGSNHDGRTVCIVSTHKVHLVPLHALKTDPGVGLDVFHDVADVEVAIGVGQGRGDEQAAGSGVFHSAINWVAQRAIRGAGTWRRQGPVVYRPHGLFIPVRADGRPTGPPVTFGCMLFFEIPGNFSKSSGWVLNV